MNWDDLRLFLAVARLHGLSKAARVTGRSAATLGRRMLELERAMNCELFRRRSHSYELTEQGEELLSRVSNLETLIAPLEMPTDRQGALVKVSAGSWTTFALCQRLALIPRSHPGIRLRFIAAEEVLSISHRETVIGVRNARPEQEDLICRKLGTVRFAVYATSVDVDAWVNVVGNTPSARWSEEQSGISAPVEVTNPRNALDIACNGLARTVLPTFVGDREQRLQRVSDPIVELTHDQWLVTHKQERFRAEVRQTIDRIYEAARALHRAVPLTPQTAR